MKKKLKYINNDTIKSVPKVEIRIPAQPNMGTVGIYDSENELLDSKNMTGGYAADINSYPSGQPYVSTTVVYNSERDCFLGKPPIKILSIGVVDPKGVTIPRAPKPAIETIYKGKMNVKQTKDL